MDASEVTNSSPVSDSGATQPVNSTNSPSESPETITLSIRPPIDESATPQTPAPPIEQPDSTLESHPRAPTPPPTTQSEEEVEHAYWADIEEDTSTPGEEELKEIEGAEADYSACDCRFSRFSPFPPRWQMCQIQKSDW